MPKIRNWSKVTKGKWEHDYNNWKVYTIRQTDSYSIIVRDDSHKIVKKETGFSSQEDASKWAVHWMKKNPLGDTKLPSLVKNYISDSEYERLNRFLDAGQVDRVRNELFFGTDFAKASDNERTRVDEWIMAIKESGV